MKMRYQVSSTIYFLDLLWDFLEPDLFLWDLLCDFLDPDLLWDFLWDFLDPDFQASAAAIIIFLGEPL